MRGHIPIRGGSVKLTNTLATVTAELDPAGITTGIRLRDNHLRSAQFLDVDRFPELRFDGESSDELTSVRGYLTLHGASVMTTLHLQDVRRHPARIDVVATARVDRLSFGITAMRGLIPRYVDVELTVSLITNER